jgi:hypothetical protein
LPNARNLTLYNMCTIHAHVTNNTATSCVTYFVYHIQKLSFPDPRVGGVQLGS